MRLLLRVLCFTVVLPLSQAAAINRQSLVAGMPIRFERAVASYFARGSGWSLALTPSAAELTCADPKLERASKIRMRMLDQSLDASLEASELLAGATNYFVGREPARTGVAAFGRVTYRHAYPGIDLAFYGSQGRLEYDFILAPGADPSKIRFELSGSESLHLSEAGDLILNTEAGDITWRHPAIYQEQQKRRTAVAGGFRLEGKVVSFEIGAYDRTQPLVIDPVLSYATYLGGSANEMARGIAVDGAGNIYVTGFTTSPDLPVTAHPIQAAFGGHTTAFLTGDAYVAKFTSAGALAYLTYLGGAADDAGLAIAVDSSGSAYVTGTTNSSNFPVTTGALQSTFAGTGFGGSGRIRGGDAFVSKLSPDGSQLMYSTYLGGRLEDLGIAIAVDASGAAYIAGATLSQNFPTTPGVVQTSFKGSGGQPILPDYGVATITAGDAFVTKLDPTGAHMIFSTLLGGGRDDAPFAIAVDATGNVFIAGYTISSDFPTTSGSFQRQLGGREPQSPFFNFGDGFVAKLNPTATALIYSTYFGGSGDDAVMGLAIDKSGNAYITGSSSSRNLPVSAGAFQKAYKGYISLPFLIEQLFGDAFVAKLNSSGSGLVYCTYLGGSVNDMGLSIAVDSSGNAFVGGWTDSTDFPVSADAAQHAMAGDGGQQDFILFGDGFLSEIDPSGAKLLYGTFFGGTRDDLILGLTLDGGGNVYAAGNTLSGNLPVTAAAAQAKYAGAAAVPVFLTGDSFVTKYSGFGSSTPAVPKLASVTNAASNTAGTVSPGMIFVGYGSNLGPAALTYGTVGADGRLDNSQSGIHILFDGDPAPLLYVLAGQVAGIVPYSVAGKQITQVVVKDDNTGQQSAPLTLQVQAAAPGLFSADSSGHGQGAFLNEDASANSSTNPAKKGSVVVIYATGEGQTKPAGVDGLIATGTPPKPVLPVSVTIGGLPATIEYMGGAPAQVAGLMQVNARMSTKVGSGNQQVILKIGSFSAQGNVTVAVK